MMIAASVKLLVQLDRVAVRDRIANIQQCQVAGAQDMLWAADTVNDCLIPDW